jgi:hypothetical protein
MASTSVMCTQPPTLVRAGPEASSWLRWRWLVLLVFLPGIIGFRSAFPDAATSQLTCSLISALVCALLLTHLRRPLVQTLWCWVMLFVFLVGFYLKFYIISYMFDTDLYGTLYGYELAWLTNQSMSSGIQWTTVGFSVFCLTASWLLSIPFPAKEQRSEVGMTHSTNRIKAFMVLIAVFTLSAVASYLPVVFGFGQMGLEHHALPFRIDALVTRFRDALAPLVFLSIIHLSDTAQTRSLHSLSLFLFFLAVTVTSIVTTSRSALLVAALPVGFMWSLGGTFSRSRARMIILMVALTVVLYPFFTDMRRQRMLGVGVGMGQIIAAADTTAATGLLPTALLKSVSRVSGLPGLLHSLRYGPGPFEPARLLWLVDNGAITGYYTHEIVGIPYGLVDARAPGILGVFVLVGGPYGLILVAPYTCLVWWVWRKLRLLQSYQVVLAFAASSVLFYTSEGTMGLQSPVAWTCAIVINQWLYARLLSDPRMAKRRLSSDRARCSDGRCRALSGLSPQNLPGTRGSHEV